MSIGNAGGFNAHALTELGRWLKANGYRFTTVTPATHERVNRRAANSLAHDLQGIFGWNRPYFPGTLPPECRALMQEAGIEQVEVQQAKAQAEGALYRSRLRASTLDRELLFHSSFPTKDAESVFFGPDTYRFVGALRRLLADVGDGKLRRVVDIGCGSGAAAIIAGLTVPGAEVHAVDINPHALQLCEINAAIAGAQNVLATPSDLLSGVPGQFDLIMANPPYMMDPAERAYRHGGGERGDGLSRAIVDEALQRLAPGGRLLLYTGVAVTRGRDPLLEWAGERLHRQPVTWCYEELDPDVFGEELERPPYGDVDRIAVVLLQLMRAD